MYKHFINLYLRNFNLQKSFSILTIASLAIGLACCLLISLWIYDELSFDKFHPEVDRIHQVLMNGQISNNPSTPIPLTPALEAETPEIEYASRYEGLFEILLSNGRDEFYEDDIKAVDPSFFKIFSFQFIRGNPATALEELNSIVISERIARKYFGDENPVGEVLQMDNRHNLTVTGVMKNIPHNSSIQFEMAVSFETRLVQIRQMTGKEPVSWGWWSPQAFIKIREHTSPKELEATLADFVQRHDENEDATVTLLPFTERYPFFTHINTYIFIFAAITLFILSISCINFVNLSTARYTQKAREIGIRKVNGATRNDIILQFLGEAVIFSFAALLIALVLVELLFPYFNSVTGKQLSIADIIGGFFLPLLIIFTLFIGLVSGSYPAFVLASYQPVKGLGGSMKFGAERVVFRKILVVLQFSLSVFLIIGSIVIFRQLDYMKNKDVGYNKEQLVSISLKGETYKNFNVLKQALLDDNKIPGVTGIAADFPFFSWSTSTSDWPGKDPTRKVVTSNNIVNYDFIETMGIKLLEGRSFSRDRASDINNAYIINEEMLKLMGPEAGVGSSLTYWGNIGTVIGVVKNFHFKPMGSYIEPLVLILDPSKTRNILIRIPPDNIPETIASVRKTWERIVPDYPFDFHFIDAAFERAYRATERMGSLAGAATLVALLISCLGLFGLASFSVERRTREVGIRKALGASVFNIVHLILREFLVLVLIANFIAWPIAYIIMHNWLNNFAYRIEFSWNIFILAGLMALLIASITVGFQTFKTAMTKPIDTLRYE